MRDPALNSLLNVRPCPALLCRLRDPALLSPAEVATAGALLTCARAARTAQGTDSAAGHRSKEARDQMVCKNTVCKNTGKDASVVESSVGAAFRCKAATHWSALLPRRSSPHHIGCADRQQQRPAHQCS